LPLLIRERGSGTRIALERALAERGVDLGTLRVAAELDSTTAIKQAIREGHGVSFMSELTIAAERETGVIRVLPVGRLGPIRRSYYIVTSRRRVLSPIAQTFLAYLSEKRTAAGSERRGGTRPAGRTARGKGSAGRTGR
jgi:DNA-binding transcriptional LysR family regulator